MALYVDEPDGHKPEMLALTRKFIELHGGRIWLTSTLGKGSMFSFTLPITHPTVQAAA